MFAFLFAGIFTTIGAISDVRTRKLPNKLTVPVCLMGLAFHVIGGLWSGGLSGMIGSWQGSENIGNGLLFALAGFATGFGILFVLFAIGGGGGGDVKMMAALGTWLGAWLMLEVFLVTAVFTVIGAFLVTIQVVAQGGLKSFKRKHMKRGGEASQRRLVAYGVPTAMATWTVFAVEWLKTAGVAL